MSLDFEMVSGDTKKLKITINNSDDTPYDITGSTDIKWQLFINNTPEISKDLGAGIIITDGVNGILTISIDPADTDNLEGTYFHELQIKDASGNVLTPRNPDNFDCGEAKIHKDLITPG